jgi:NAD-dependent dihydropyrimidine dehydrogenase PreA subunit
VLECPEKALQMKRRGEKYAITINLALCNGVACRRCERACKEKTFDLIALLSSGGDLPEQADQTMGKTEDGPQDSG